MPKIIKVIICKLINTDQILNQFHAIVKRICSRHLNSIEHGKLKSKLHEITEISVKENCKITRFEWFYFDWIRNKKIELENLFLKKFRLTMNARELNNTQNNLEQNTKECFCLWYEWKWNNSKPKKKKV